MASSVFTTPLQTRQLFYFFDPHSTNVNFTPRLNPLTVVRKVGNVRKYTMTTNGTSVILGDNEYPPSEIALTWPMMDDSDYQAFTQMTTINPVVMIDNNDNGYLGVLMVDEAQQLAKVSMKVWSVKASFLVLCPYDGQTTTLNRVAPPTLSVVGWYNLIAGYVPANTNIYLWSTVFTPWGESLTSAMLTANSGAMSNAYCTLSWTPPSSPYLIKTRLYWNSTATESNATMLTEVLAGQSASFTVWSPYVGYNTLYPPTINRAFSGYWAGGKWVQQ